MAEYIPREAVLKFIEDGLNNPDRAKAFGYDAVCIMGEVRFMDAADVVEVVHGRWISTEEKPHLIYRCSKCGDKWSYGAMLHFKYCPSCGARMDCDEECGKGKES